MQESDRLREKIEGLLSWYAQFNWIQLASISIDVNYWIGKWIVSDDDMCSFIWASYEAECWELFPAERI